MADKKDKKDKKEDQEKDRKPLDYKEEDVPKVLKGPLKPSYKDYDTPVGPWMDGEGPRGMGFGPGRGMGPCGQKKLICPVCGMDAPFSFDSMPPGRVLSKLSALCHQCGSTVPLRNLGLTEDGNYEAMV